MNRAWMPNPQADCAARLRETPSSLQRPAIGTRTPAERRRPVDSCDIQTGVSGDVRPGARATGLGGAIVVPIFQGDRVAGTLGIANHTERTFGQAEIASLLAIGGTLVRFLPS